MNINNVVFERSFGVSSQLTPSTMPEIAFAGRSNVGKSSLLNKLFNRKGLAKVSQTPGKTATINFFSCDGVRFVDLPGYGYAKVSKSDKSRWSELIEGYFNQDRDLALVVSLVDIRHEASDLDVNMIGRAAVRRGADEGRQAQPSAADEAEGRPEEAAEAGGRRAARGVLVGEGHRHRRTALAHQEQRAVGAATACTRKKTAPKGRFLSLEESGATGER